MLDERVGKPIQHENCVGRVRKNWKKSSNQSNISSNIAFFPCWMKCWIGFADRKICEKIENRVG